ncbi:hypothetical protein CRE_22946 [Caenorhabditis remanei]|uniref:Uncharacterized protein n=1 Tax=Caenorhabditis remanei TaxID=31234 RepID=E3MVZ1_CAERE|nr:hypothetical protein CRE_22946 [Caenorhabditis remanei]
MVEVGKFASDIMGKYLGPIGTVAGFVKDIIEHFEEKKEDPVLREIKELSMQLSALSQKMTTHFDDLKSFVVEQNFYDVSSNQFLLQHFF